MSQTEHKAAFFRQSGWLMFANIAGGVLMWAVHFLNKFIPPGAYGSFGAFLAVVMLLPTIPLQMVLAHQTAKAIAENREGELSGMIRRIWLATFLFWLLGAILVLAFQGTILQRWQLDSPVGLWVTMFIVLFSLWLPVFWGVLQGRQNFLWLGWSMISNAIGRIVVASFAVIVLGAAAAGMMVGVLLGTLVAVSLAAWQARKLWLAKPQRVHWGNFLNQVIPLMMAFAGFQILFTADTLVVKTLFNEREADFYVSAGTLSRALMWFVLPLASVMFPRIVQSVAKSEKSNLVGMVLLVTAALALMGVLGLWLLGPWVIPIVYQPSFVEVAGQLLPWYAGAMVPLALSNVLLNNFFARPAAKWLPALAIFGIAVLYVLALIKFNDHNLVTVLKILGLFNLALLGVCAFLTWGPKMQRSQPVEASSGAAT